MAIITLQDFKDIGVRFWQRGARQYFKKVFKSNNNRTIATFDANSQHANWWLLPQVHAYLQQAMQIGVYEHYMHYTIAKFANQKSNLNILSVGCGNGAQEMLWAHLVPNAKIIAIDLTPNNIAEANELAKKKQLKNIIFKVSSWEQFEYTEKFDAVLFHSSLHHLANMEKVFLKIKTLLQNDGILVLHEYVGATKHQFTKTQIDAANKVLNKTPKVYKKIFRTPFYKHSIGKPGLLRMYLNDPSEAIEADKIRPMLYKYTNVLVQREMGGNVFVLYLKEIAHHFAQENAVTSSLLKNVFDAELPFIDKQEADFIFGVYTFKK